jgi:glycosyltransferase involved in cell wall biosynthesis
VPDFLVFAALPAKLLGARVILDIHDILPEFYASKFGIRSDSLLFKTLVAVERVSAWCADKVIVANELWEERLASRSVPAAKCTTVRNYPDPAIFVRQAATRTDHKFVILYPGSLNHHQGLDIAICAFGKALPNLQNAEFHIYGEGRTLPDLKKLVQTLGLTDSVIFHRGVPAREVPRVMSNADLSVVPKRASSSFGTEAASTKIMEFMAMGVPVIVSRTKIDSLYHNLSRVEFFESENVDQLAAAMVRLKQDSTRREELIRNGLKYVQEHNWAIKKRDYLNLLDELASHSRPTRAEETKLAEESARRPTRV